MLPLINGQDLPPPVLVDPRVKVQLPHAQTAEKPRDRDAEQDLPDDPECISERLPHLVFERLIQRPDGRYRRKCDLDALRKLRKERGGQLSLQLVL